MKKILIFALFCGLLFSITSSAFALEEGNIEVIFDDAKTSVIKEQTINTATLEKSSVKFHFFDLQDFRTVLKSERSNWESNGYECYIKDISRSDVNFELVATMHCKKK